MVDLEIHSSIHLMEVWVNNDVLVHSMNKDFLEEERLLTSGQVIDGLW